MNSASGTPFRALALVESQLSKEEFQQFLLSLMTPSQEELRQLKVFTKATTYIEAQNPGFNMLTATWTELFAILAWIENKPGNEILTLPKKDYDFVVEMIRRRINM
jgi:hypothetical protein